MIAHCVDTHTDDPSAATESKQPSRMPTRGRLVAVIMVVQGVLHAWMLTSALRQPSAFLRIAEDMGDVRAAYFIGLMVTTGWVAIGVVWTPVNAWGLLTGRPWARKSVIAYCALAIPTGCCLPLCAYGLYAMLRNDVRDRSSTGAGPSLSGRSQEERGAAKVLR